MISVWGESGGLIVRLPAISAHAAELLGSALGVHARVAADKARAGGALYPEG